MDDIFSRKAYGCLYEEIEGGRCEVYEFKSSFGSIRQLFIKKEIPLKVNGIIYYDLTSPYGYGGPIITEFIENKKQNLVESFEAAFQKYCIDNNIVSEFIRFHPVLENAKDFKHVYELSFRRLTTGTNLKDFEDPIQNEFSKSCRRNIRKSLDAGVTYNIIEQPKCLKNFIALYHSTMERNNADSIYFFDEKFFSNFISLLGKHAVLIEVLHNGKVIGAGLNIAYNRIIHTYLSGTLADYHHLSPAYILQYALAKWGKENGYRLIHDGGGRTGQPDDKLYQFKKQFGRNTDFEYYAGHKIWNEQIYDYLCKIAGSAEDADFFPAYRLDSLLPVR